VDIQDVQAVHAASDLFPKQSSLNMDLDNLRKAGKLKETVEQLWPFVDRINPHFAAASLNRLMRPSLDDFIANIRKGEPTMYEEPAIFNGFKTYANPQRFAAEIDTFKKGIVIAGFSGDLAQPNDYKRFQCFGKSLLLTRDAQGQFHAFENVCRHRGMELVPESAPVGNRSLHVCPYHSW
jgi:hypothetical protein